jgi:hypothetical protein
MSTSWIDSQDVFQQNEIAINWNAALIYALAGFAGGNGDVVGDSGADVSIDSVAIDAGVDTSVDGAAASGEPSTDIAVPNDAPPGIEEADDRSPCEGCDSPTVTPCDGCNDGSPLDSEGTTED